MILPIDWFAPTGNLFRELGAKPAVFVLFCLMPFFIMRVIYHKNIKVPSWLVMNIFLMLLLGVASFFMSYLVKDVGEGYFKPPLMQFIFQLGMFGSFYLLLLLLIDFFHRNNEDFKIVLRMFPMAAFFHFSIFLLESQGLLDDSSGWLLNFRVDGGLIERPTGLFSEPSYYGFFAAIYGAPLLLMKPFRKWYFRVLGVTLIVSAVMINAKSIFPVLFFQLLYLAITSNGSRVSFYKIFIYSGLSFAVFIYFLSQNTVSVYENMSVAYRLGANLLAFNAAIDNYFLGVGFGQFHYYFLYQYAPDFLLISQEVQPMFSPDSLTRASTFNVYLRYLVELGLGGVVLFILILYSAAKISWKSKSHIAQLSGFGVFGCIGFMFTQDSYFYPQLLFYLAILFGLIQMKKNGT